MLPTPLPARLAAVPLSTRFRLLRLAIESRRRALAQLLRAGIPEDLSECRELIERLESPRARSFCFAALAGRSGAGRQASLRPPTES